MIVVFLLLQPILSSGLSAIGCFQGSQQICRPRCRASLAGNCWLRAALCVHTCACARVSACVCVCCVRFGVQCPNRAEDVSVWCVGTLMQFSIYASMACMRCKTQLYLLPKECSQQHLKSALIFHHSTPLSYSPSSVGNFKESALKVHFQSENLTSASLWPMISIKEGLRFISDPLSALKETRLLF